MRSRRWVLLVFAFFIAVFLLWLHARQVITTNNQEIKRFVLTKIRPIFGDACDIERVYIGIGTLHFYGVSIPFPEKRISLKIKDLRFGYNISKLLFYRGFDPRIFTRDILIINPTVYLEAPSGASLEKNGAPALSMHVDQFIKQLTFLSRVSIKKGDLVFKISEQKNVIIASQLSGWLEKDATDSLHIQLDGHVLSRDVQNLSITGCASTKTGIVSSLAAKINNFQLPLLNALSDSLDMEFIDGRIDGEVRLVNPVDSTGNLQFAGFININNGTAALKVDSLLLENADLQIIFENQNLILQKASYRLNGNEFTALGTLSRFFDPEIDLHIAGENVQMFDFIHINKSGESELSSFARVDVQINGPIRNLVIKGGVRTHECRIGNNKLTNLLIDVLYKAKSFEIQRCKAQFLGLDLFLNGQVDLKNPESPLNGSLNVKGDWAKLLDPLTGMNISSAPVWLETEIGGTLRQPILFGNCGIDVLSAPEDMEVLSTTAAISFSNKIIRARSSNNKDRRFQIVADFSQSVPYFQVNIDHLEEFWTNFFRYPGDRYFQENFALCIDAQGDRHNFELNTYVKHVEGGVEKKDVLKIISVIERENGVTSSSGTIFLHPETLHEIQGQFALIKDKDGLRVKRFSLGENVNAVYYSYNDTQTNNGNLTVSDLSVSELLLTPDSTFAGALDIDLQIDGSTISPQISCNAKIKDLFIHNFGPYVSEVSFNYKNNRLQLNNLMLNSQDATLGYAQGEYNLLSDSIRFSIKGAGFDAGAFAATRNRTQPAVSGRALVDVQISGTAKNPTFDGIVAIKEGKLLFFPFDELEIVLEPPASDDTTKSSQLNFKSFRLTRHDVFEVNGSGFFPLKAQDSLYFNCQGHGNFLALLPDVDSFFMNPFSQGNFNAKIRGSRIQPVLETLKLNFDKGKMEFKDVVPPITDVVGDIEFETENLFIHLHELKGKMGGKAFSIYTVPAAEVPCEQPLNNMHLGPSGMNIGVLVLETPEQGVPLSFTGLMEPGVYGRLNLLGRQEGEKFYLAGPSDRPVLRGAIEMYNVEFMYPFYQTNHKPSPHVKRFLESIEWDVFVRPVKDVRYVKTFPGAIDKAYVNLQLDEKYGGLEFTGQIADQSWRINGIVRSTAGFIEYLDMNFRIERAGAEFDRSSLIPVVYGQAKTTVSDSMGMPTEITLTLQTVDETIDQKSVDDNVRQEQGRARWDEIRFKLSSNSPHMGDSEAQVMASLGYSTETLQNKAFDAIGFSTENIIFRPLFRPVERKIEHVFGLDYVRFSSRFAKNLIDFNLNNNYELNSRLSLLRSTKVILGKYLADRMFLQYTGQVEAGIDYRYKEKSVGLHHTLGLEY
ncbi:hypothetical protein JW935_02785, partial [candidate division KSB1 bacterium]|nr:hypothetical protein [candidate division KSB1 bacterium]